MSNNTSAASGRRAATALAPLLAAALLAAPGWALGQQQDAPPAALSAQGEEEITLNLKDADISALISTVAEVTGRNFIIDPRVRAKVTVISRRPMDPKELYRVFLSILQVHGFSAVETGEVIKIVPDINAKQLGPEPGRVAEALPSDQIVTRVLPVENIPVAQLIPILRPLVPQQGHLAAYPPTNVLIVSDRAANVERLTEIINRIDRASDDEIQMIQLENASAPELVRVITSLMQRQQAGAEGPAGAGLQLAADERTNSILISGDRSARMRVQALIAHLDAPIGEGGDTRVVYLKYANAKELVPVLTGVAENIEQTESGDGVEVAARTTTTPAADEEVSIQAHEATNALVISAPPKVMESLETVIRQLDVRRAQVLIEAAIAEIAMNKNRELGVQWAAAKDDVVAQTNFGADTSGGIAAYFADLVVGNPVTTSASGLSLLLGDLTGSSQWAALIRALATDTDTNILSTPSLLTLDNQEAEIRVAQNVPIVTGSFTNQGNNAANPFQTIEREDVGLILKVKPQINEGDSVLLDIEQEASTVVDATNQAGIITDKRSIKTSVLVEDGDLVVLGGLMDEDVQETEQRVPGLGSIPLVGELFTYRAAEKGKRNLMVFLRPQIMRSEDALDFHTSRKYNYMRAQQLVERRNGIDLLPNEQAPVLPELDATQLPAPFEPE